MSDFDEMVRVVAFADPAKPILEDVVPMVRTMLGADQALAYRVSSGESGFALDFAHTVGLGPHRGFVDAVSGYVSKATCRMTTYDFPIPNRRERNSVHLLRNEELRRKQEEAPLVRDLFPALGLAGQDQIRVLVCDGSRLLSWVGAFRLDPFGPEEERKLERIIPLLEHRLRVEEAVGRLTAQAAALDVAIEAHREPTVFLDSKGAPLHANAAARALSRDELAALLADGKRLLQTGANSKRLTVHRIECHGLSPHHLLMQHRAESSVEERARLSTCRWGLSKRQSEVLALLLEGRSNREVAQALQIAEGTVELHVSGILKKASVRSRSELIAASWSRLPVH